MSLIWNLPLLVPFHGGIVHLVDENDQVLNAGRLHQHGMLSRLTAAVEARLELSLASANNLKHTSDNYRNNWREGCAATDQHSQVRLCGPAYHVGHE